MRGKRIGLMVVMLGLAESGARAAQEGRPFSLCVLDQAAVVQQSRLARNMGVRFQQVRQQEQAKLENDQRTLDADARALENLRSSLPAAVAKSHEEDIARRRAQLKVRVDKVNQDLAALNDQLTANVAKLSDPVARAIEAERGCSMLIDKSTIIHLDDGSLDITQAVIARMNAAPLPAASR